MRTEKTIHQSAVRLHPALLVGALLIAATMSIPAYSATATFAGDCITPKVTFNLGETICARATGLAGLRFAFVNPDGFIVHKAAITTDPQAESFTLPSTNESVIDGTLTANNLGTWRVNAITSRGGVKTESFFTVRNPAAARADLSIVNSVAGGSTPIAGAPIQFVVVISNRGPDDAMNVRLADDAFTNATFQSVLQTSGPAFSCTGSSCTIASLAPGAAARFVWSFTAGAAGGMLVNTARLTSDTPDLNPADNSSTAPPLQVGTGAASSTCNLECPNNITATANATQGSQTGAFVVFPGAEVFGTCGTVSTSPASGSFFPTGSTTVTASSSSGGGTCSFSVTVIVTAPPAITCPPAIAGQAPAGQASVYLPDPKGTSSNPGTATATGSNVSILGERSDDEPLNATYPVGTTTILWRATDDGGRTASCTQPITVTSSEAPSITCPPNRSFTAPSGSCQVTLTAESLGQPSTSGSGVSATGVRSDGEALSEPFPAGDTFITWTAASPSGQVSCIQRIQIRAVDTNSPVLTVPPDVTVAADSCFATVDDELGSASAVDDCSGSVSIVRSGIPPSFVFPTGTTRVTYTATDAAGNTASAVQRVIVLEIPAERPTINPPPDITVRTGAGASSCSVFVSDTTLGAASAADNCAGVSISRTGVPSGNLFPVGDVLVRYTATDAAGNTATATQKVSVIDDTAPVVIAPPAVMLFTGPGATTCGVTVADLDAALGTATATDNCPGVGAVIRGGVLAGNSFPVGTTTLTYSVTDGHGNVSSGVQVVSVADNTAPVMTCPINLSLEPTCPSGAVARWAAPVGTDNCPLTTTRLSAGPASGSVFPVGASTVTYTARDAAGNETACSFTVTVLTAAATIKNLRTSVNGASLNGPQQQGLISKLDATAAAMERGNGNSTCQTLATFIKSVENHRDKRDITAAQAEAWLRSAANLENVLGCTSRPCI